MKNFTRTALISAMLLASTAVEAKTFVFCSEGSPEGFNPQLFSSSTTFDASSTPLYNRLVEFKLGTSTLIPGLAEKWDVSPDGKTWTFHLRKSVKFHSNKAFTPTRDFNADDVLFSFNRQLNQNSPYHNVSGGNYEYFAGMGLDTLIQKIQKRDDYTVEFTLARPHASFPADLAIDFGSILSAEYADKMLAAHTPENVDNNPIGTGPFELVAYQKDTRILYKAFANYWGNKPKIDRLVFSITPDAAIRYAKLKKNECQAMAFPNPADLNDMRQNPSITLQHQQGLNTGFLAFNVQKRPLDNVTIRQALATAINKKAIIDAVFQGAGIQAKNLIPPAMWAANNSVTDYPYDPQKAKALLKQAGVPQGFSIDLWAMPVQRPYNPNARRMAEMIQADWAKVGVKANIVSYEWGEYLKRARSGEHQAMLMGWTSDNGEPGELMSTLYSCKSAADGSNYARWCDKNFDSLLSQAQSEQDREKRKGLYYQAQEIMHSQMPAVMIAHSIVYEPVRKEVSGYQIDPLGKHHFETVSLN